MKTLIEPIAVWQALSLLGLARDGKPMSEERCRRALRDIGMKESEMDQPYPEEAMQELIQLMSDPANLDAVVDEASQWMIKRN